MSEIYELTYRINGQPERPIIRRGSLVELQAAISDALHYDLDHLELKREVARPGVTVKIKQAPINTANHKCWSCGKSIRSVFEQGTEYWVHQGTNMVCCQSDDGINGDYAYPTKPEQGL